MTLTQALAPFVGKYSPAFLCSATFLLPWEAEFEKGHYGDWSHVRAENVPNDPGGQTKYGVDKRSHPHEDIPNLSLARALQIYQDAYWLPVYGDDLPADIALATFDAGANCGVALAAKWLQIAAGAKPIDGKIGNITLAAVRGHQTGLLEAIIDQREDYYHRLGQRPQFKKFLPGWLNRTDAIRKELGLPIKVG